MSIDAKVKIVIRYGDGSGKLVMVDRPSKRAGENPGIKGQSNLSFDRSPIEVFDLEGMEIWGSADSLVLGETIIAKRIGYTRIEFVDVETIKSAIEAYETRHK